MLAIEWGGAVNTDAHRVTEMDCAQYLVLLSVQYLFAFYETRIRVHGL